MRERLTQEAHVGCHWLGRLGQCYPYRKSVVLIGPEYRSVDLVQAGDQMAHCRSRSHPPSLPAQCQSVTHVASVQFTEVISSESLQLKVDATDGLRTMPSLTDVMLWSGELQRELLLK